MLRVPLASERIQRIDPETGIKVIQITSYPTQSVHLDYAWPSVTPDNSRVFFYSQRSASRTAPWDLFRCDTDGLNLFQLTEHVPNGGVPGQVGAPQVMTALDGLSLFVSWPGEEILFRVDAETGEMEELCDLKPYVPEGYLLAAVRPSFAPDEMLMNVRSYRHGDASIYRLNLRTGGVDLILENASLQGVFYDARRLWVLKNFMQLGTTTTADGTRIYTNTSPREMEIYSTDDDGGDQRHMCGMIFGHSTSLGRKNAIQGTGRPPERCIWIVEAGREPRALTRGPYFWHSGASFDGEWIISDTNWPDEGLYLINVATGRHRLLCHARATQEHTQYSHTHPTLSQDGRVAVFGSDRSGVYQVYVAHIPDDFRESVIAGELDRPKDKWI